MLAAQFALHILEIATQRALAIMCPFCPAPCMTRSGRLERWPSGLRNTPGNGHRATPCTGENGPETWTNLFTSLFTAVVFSSEVSDEEKRATRLLMSLIAMQPAQREHTKDG
jgi:hypothetical protein